MLRLEVILLSLGFALIFAKPHITEEQKENFVKHVKSNDNNMFFVAFNPDDEKQGDEKSRKVQKRDVTERKVDEGIQTDLSGSVELDDEDGDEENDNEQKIDLKSQHKMPTEQDAQGVSTLHKDHQPDDSHDSPRHQEEEYEEF